jgi:hypothetical protein
MRATASMSSTFRPATAAAIDLSPATLPVTLRDITTITPKTA